MRAAAATGGDGGGDGGDGGTARVVEAARSGNDQQWGMSFTPNFEASQRHGAFAPRALDARPLAYRAAASFERGTATRSVSVPKPNARSPRSSMRLSLHTFLHHGRADW